MIPILLTTAAPSSRPAITTIATVDLVSWNAINSGGWRERLTPIADWIHLIACAEAAFDESPVLRTIWITDTLRDFREDVGQEILAQLEHRPGRPYKPSLTKLL